MKSIKRLFVLLICVSLIFGLFTFNLFTVSAGVSDKNIANTTSFKYNISNADWLNNGISVKNCCLYFSPTGNDSDRIISFNKIDNLKELGFIECFNGEITVTPIVMTGTFYIMFGLDGLSSSKTWAETENTSAIAITAQDDEIYLSVVNFDEEATEQFVLNPTKLENVKLSDAVNIKLSVNVDGGVVIDVNGENVLNESNAEFDTVGYFGFAQNSINEIYVNKVDINAYTNVTPENFNYVERFDKDEMNHNAWYTVSQIGYYKNSYLKSENGVLHFSNVGKAQVSSKYQFSNFVLDFDLADMQRVVEYDENGNVNRPVNKQFGIAIGSTSYKSYDTPVYMFRFYGEGASALKGANSTILAIEEYGKTVSSLILPEAYNIWDDNLVGGRSVNFKVKVVDKVATIMIKYSDEIGYTTLCNFNMISTPNGYVKIMGYGDTYSAGTVKGVKYKEQGNFKIDNLIIKNLDFNGNVKNIGYQFYKWEIPEDFEYVDPWL